MFWLGGKPGTQKAAAAAPDATSLEPAIRDACLAHGLVPEDFVAALGGHGSWLVHFARGETRQRIVWNGREQKLVLQSPVRSGGWVDLRECPLASADGPGFVAGIAHLIRNDAGGGV